MSRNTVRKVLRSGGDGFSEIAAGSAILVHGNMRGADDAARERRPRTR